MENSLWHDLIWEMSLSILAVLRPVCFNFLNRIRHWLEICWSAVVCYCCPSWLIAGPSSDIVAIIADRLLAVAIVLLFCFVFVFFVTAA